MGVKQRFPAATEGDSLYAHVDNILGDLHHLVFRDGIGNLHILAELQGSSR